MSDWDHVLLEQQTEYERLLERGIEDRLRAAIAWATARFDEDYAYEYLSGVLSDLYAKSGLVPASKRIYQKKTIGNRLRTQVFERDAYRCVDCGTWKNLTVDHIHPEVLGGPTELENLTTRCRSCNSRKGRKPIA